MSVSDAFWEAWPAGGHIVIDCHCGRTHFADTEDAGDWERGELEGLREKANADPEHYIAHGNHDSISECQIGGLVYVWECPCGYGEKVQGWLDENRRNVLDYYARVMKAERETFERDAALMRAAAAGGGAA